MDEAHGIESNECRIPGIAFDIDSLAILRVDC